ncbi:glycosyltransferase family 39 protein [Halopolyspora algeriensis]|uniref:glycosyltransferase family 39 protein n=1 Tax=Halopolyspora algeriensis TaxID=1500506 RepID=UPI00131458EF|nr:glycosyltransferase family 39 protein [Halopolyspora algeriensis]
MTTPASRGTGTVPPGSPPLAALPYRGLLALGGGLLAVLVLTGGVYDYHGDELYFLAAGQHPSWGYADQPPLLPLLARAMDTVFAGSRLGLRLPAMALTTAGVFVTALLARELGGRPRAQLLAAAAYTVSPQTLASGRLLLTPTVDAFLWAVTTLLLVRWVRRRHARPLLWLGVVTALALQNKYLIVAFWLALGVSLLLTGPRELLRRPALWVGAALAVLATLPSLVWQVAHGWPQLQVASMVAVEVAAWAGGRPAFLPLTVLTAGVAVGAVLVCYGLWRLLRSPHLRAYRFLGWTCVGVTLLFLLAGGRYYYCAGLFPLCWAAAAVELQRHPPARWWSWVLTWPSYALSASLVLALTVAAQSLPWAAHANVLSLGSAGWRQLTSTVADTYRSLPPETRQDTAVLTDHYWQAGALDRFGPQSGLPRAHSPHRGYWYFGAPSEEADTVLFIGDEPGELRKHFRQVRRITALHGTTGFTGINKDVTLWLCSGRETPWSRLWPELRRP